MSTYILKIPSNSSQDEWFNMLKEALEYQDESFENLVVDFNVVDFLDTDDLVLLACLIESFVDNGAKVEFRNGTRALNGHLDNIKFKTYWNEGFNRNAFTKSRNSTTLCLWKINPEMIYQYTRHAKEYFEKFTDNKDLLPLSSNMDEVFNNILDHSKLEKMYGYIITQYYPKKNHISFSVCDLGVGIANRINEYYEINGEAKIEDFKAIFKAVERGFSTRSTPKNRGFGLNYINELTENSNGSLLIRSNYGFLYKRASQNYSIGNMNTYFPGTLIKVRVDLNTFDEIDDTEFINEF